MNIKIFNVALGLILTATAISASAQKAYKEGVVTVSTNAMGQTVDIKTYFRADSVASQFTGGPATIKFLSDADAKSFAVLVDVPVMSIKKAGIATPDEIDQAIAAIPTFTYAPSTETQVISGFNCKKVVATDTKTNQKYDVWITNDVSLPPTAIDKYYRNIGGFPIQYTSFSQGQAAPTTVKSIVEQKVPAGTFGIPADYERITMDELKAMRGGR